MSLFGNNRPQRYPVHDPNHHPHCVEHQHEHDMNCKDRMFQGQKPLAYLQDLKALHGQVLRWLIGPGNSFGPLGYVPLSEDGKTIDPAYIREEFVGVDVFNNAELIDKNAKTIQFRGNLVKVFKDEDGKIVIYIKQKAYSKLGTFDGLTDGNLYLSPAFATRFKKMIAPIGQARYYNGLQPGEDFFGIVGNGTDTDILSWETKDKVLFANNRDTYLVVSLLDAQGNALFTVQSARITQNTSNIIMGDNRYCTVQIFDFTPTQAQEYGGKVRLRINLASYFHRSSRFTIKVTHYNSQFNECITTWTSPGYFYLAGQKLSNETLDITARIDYDKNIVKNKVFGVTYVNDGYIRFTVTGINDLNNGAIAPIKIKFESNITDQKYEFSDADIDYRSESNLAADAQNIAWSHTFKIKQNIFYPIEPVSAKITLANAFSTVEKVWNNLSIRNQTAPAVINTYTAICQTDRITEAFDGKVIEFPDSDYGMAELISINNIFNNPYLQVVQKYGLVWPNIFGVSDTNYQRRYFKRNFGGVNTDTRLAWGGTFIFGNFTKNQFFANNFNVRISPNEGQTWYNLKSYKDGNDPFGILCKLKQKNGNLEVRFALPENATFMHNDVIQFELSMDYTNTSRITFIKLRNENNTQDF